jgi:hypothetical protein
MAISNIDELLMGGNSNQQPAPPEEQYQDEPETIDKLESEDVDSAGEQEQDEHDDKFNDEDEQVDNDDDKPKKPALEVDDYGNEQEPENEAIRDRLSRQARKHQAEIDSLRAQLAQQGASQQVQNAAKDFEYDPSEGGDWQQQLASFVKQTVTSMTNEKQESQQRNEEAQAQSQFESKFREGMNNFNDFSDVINNLPFQISNPMTLATRAMDNPAAFLYAAAKRNPQELERISKLRDPYVQMTEMGRLEERMRRNKPTTKAPRPLARPQEDSTTKVVKKVVDKSGDDLLASADAKRLAVRTQRHKSSR